MATTRSSLAERASRRALDARIDGLALKQQLVKTELAKLKAQRKSEHRSAKKKQGTP